MSNNRLVEQYGLHPSTLSKLQQGILIRRKSTRLRYMQTLLQALSDAYTKSHSPQSISILLRLASLSLHLYGLPPLEPMEMPRKVGSRH